MEWMIANMAPLMFGALVLFLLFGYPVAFALAANGIVFGLIGIELGLLQPALFQALPERIFGIMANDTLLAIPFFTFMGLVLERSGMAEDLLDTIGQLFGPMRGGLAYAVIFVGALLAATTGVVAASVISMGLISLPIMLRYGYDKRLASGVIAASGTLAQIIPPSLVLIIMADQLGKSVGDMYEGAIIPGLILTSLYVGYVIILTLIKPNAAPALPPEARTLRGFKLFVRVITTMVPPLLLIFLVLGTIFLGIATPTEGGAMGATGALILAMCRKRLTLHAAQAGHGNHRQALVLRRLHPGRLHGLRPRLPRGQWRPLGRAPAARPARRPGRLPDRRATSWSLSSPSSSTSSSCPSSSCRCWPRWRTSWASTWSGSACCSRSTCRLRSCTRPSASRSSTCARSPRPRSRRRTSTGAPFPFVCIQIIMVALIIIFPGIVSYGDEQQKAQQQMEKDGTAPPPVDLDSLMKRDEGSSEASKQDDENAASNLLKNLQGDK